MRHSGNNAKQIDASYGGEGVTIRLYVYDELDRFVTVTRASFSLKEVDAFADGIRQRRAALDQMSFEDL